MPVSRCVQKLVKQSNGKLTNDEAQKILKDTDKLAKSLAGKGYDEKASISKAVSRRLENVKKNVEKEKENTLRNVVIQAETLTRIQNRIKNGLPVHEAFLTEIIGNAGGFDGSRNSVDLFQDTIVSSYAGRMVSDLEREKLTPILGSGKFTKEIANDLWSLSNGNKVISSNKDVNKIANIIHTLQKDMISRMNKAGADIQDINGFIVSQSHDVDKMHLAGKKKWIDTVKPRLDLAKSFDETDNIDDALDSAYEALVTGIRFTQVKPQDEKLFQFSGPANLAKKVSSKRQLIFKSADDFLSYNEEFGRSSFNESLEAGIRNGARDIALMERFGTNPEAMMRSVKKKMQENNRELLSEKGLKKETLINDSIDTVVGNIDHSTNPSMTRINNNIKAWNNIRLLGATPLSALADMFIKPFEYMYQGRNLLSATLQSFKDMAYGFKSIEERKRFSSLVGVYAENFIGDINEKLNDSKNFSSKATKTVRLFHKITGLSWMDATGKLSFARTMAHDLAFDSKKKFNDLNEDLQRALRLYDINSSDWDVIRKNKVKLDDGRDYVVAEGIGDQIISDKLRSYFIDRANHAIVTPTGSTKARMAFGTRRGTIGGEILSNVMQLKSFMFAFNEKILGRALYGKGQTDYKALAQLIVMTTIGGYIAMTAKDFARGKKPRDPFLPENIFGAIVQGGGLGIMGDIVFQDDSMFGKSFVDIMAGPTLSTINDANKLFKTIKAGRDPKAQAFRMGVGMLPAQNLFYIREPINHLILYEIQEHLSPGFLQRMEKNMRENKGQEYYLKPAG